MPGQMYRTYDLSADVDYGTSIVAVVDENDPSLRTHAAEPITLTKAADLQPHEVFYLTPDADRCWTVQRSRPVQQPDEHGHLQNTQKLVVDAISSRHDVASMLLNLDDKFYVLENSNPLNVPFPVEAQELYGDFHSGHLHNDGCRLLYVHRDTTETEMVDVSADEDGIIVSLDGQVHRKMALHELVTVVLRPVATPA